MRLIGARASFVVALRRSSAIRAQSESTWLKRVMGDYMGEECRP